MYKILHTLIFIFILSSCASTSDENNAYSTYKEFIQKTKNGENSLVLSMLSIRNKEDLLKNSTVKGLGKYFPTLSSLHTVLVKETEHYQGNKGNKVCLTVNGFDSSHEPTSINIEYVVEKEGLKLDYIQVMFHASVKEFPLIATCPVRL